MVRALLRILVIAALASLPPALAEAGIPQVKHVVIIIQENRTPDNLFHGLDKYLPKADIANSGVDSKGRTIQMTAVPLAVAFDLNHSHVAFEHMYDNGKMDGADRVGCIPYFGSCGDYAPFHYVQAHDVQPYFALARNYGFANRMFQTNQGPSYPAHLFLFGGTSQPAPNSPLFVAGNPSGGVGCTAPAKAYVSMIDPAGGGGARMYPCFETQTLSDLLDRPPHDPTHPISWRYYAPQIENTNSYANLWTAPVSIRHLCLPAGSPLVCTDAHWRTGNIVTWPPQVLVDIQKHTLQNVSWVIPTGQDSDHATNSNGDGPSWVASIVNAIGNSSYWDNTVILITWDDWGGWYDHVKPPIDSKYGYYEYGFRVPLLVVSPYTAKGYISNKQHDFGSILKFVETVFNLGTIPPGNFADSRADDLADFFDFTKKPRAFTKVPQITPASRFLDRNRAMTAPDDD